MDGKTVRTSEDAMRAFGTSEARKTPSPKREKVLTSRYLSRVVWERVAWTTMTWRLTMAIARVPLVNMMVIGMFVIECGIDWLAQGSR